MSNSPGFLTALPTSTYMDTSSFGSQLAPYTNTASMFQGINTPAPTLAGVGLDAGAQLNKYTDPTSMFGSINTPAPTLASTQQGTGITGWLNKGIAPTVTDPTTGAITANPELYTRGDVAAGIGSLVQGGIGAYGMFQGLDQQQQSIDISKGNLDLNRETFAENQRHNQAIVAQNRGS